MLSHQNITTTTPLPFLTLAFEQRIQPRRRPQALGYVCEMPHGRSAVWTIPRLLDGRHLGHHALHLPPVKRLSDHDRAAARSTREHGTRFRQPGHLAWAITLGHDGRQLVDVIYAELRAFAEGDRRYLELLRRGRILVDLYICVGRQRFVEKKTRLETSRKRLAQQVTAVASYYAVAAALSAWVSYQSATHCSVLYPTGTYCHSRDRPKKSRCCHQNQLFKPRTWTNTPNSL